MTTDDYALHMPPHIRPEFAAWLAKREAQAGWRGFERGYDHGYHDGQQGNARILAAAT